MDVRTLLLAALLALCGGPALAQAPKAPEPLPRTKNARKLRSLIRDLGHEAFATREAAREAILTLGEEALPYLERATRDPDTERRTNAKELLEAMRWTVPEELRRVVGDALENFHQQPTRERLLALRAFLQRPHEARVGVSFLVTVARFDPDADVRQAAARVYLEVTGGPEPRFDGLVLGALTDEKPSALVEFLRARLHRNLGDPAAAAASAEAALALSPGSAQITGLLIEVYLEGDQPAKALPFAQAAAKREPQSLVLRCQLGEALIRAGSRDEGLALLATVLAATKDTDGKPTLPPLEVMLRLGEAYLRAEEPSEATAVYRKALTQFPFDRRLNIAMGDVYRATGKVHDAVQVYLSEIRYAASDPPSPEYSALCKRLGEILEAANAGWITREEEFFEDAQRGRPVIDARRAVGNWLLKRGLNAEAVAELRVVTALAPESVLAWTELGQALTATGDYAAAKASYERALRLDPKAGRAAALLRDLEVLSAQDSAGGPARSPEGFALWEARFEQRTLARSEAAVSAGAPPPIEVGSRVLVPAPGTVDVYSLASEDGRVQWRFSPEAAPRKTGELPEQIGLGPVALCTVSPGVVAAVSPRRARDPKPLVAVLYNVFWRPVHRSWKSSKFRGLRVYVIDPETGKTILATSLDRLAQAVPPAGVARRGRLLSYASRRRKRVELELIDLVQRRPLWRAAMPKGVLRRPLVVGERALAAWAGGVAAIGSDGRSTWTHRRGGKGAEASDEGSLTTSLIALNDSVVFGTSDGRLIALDLDDGEARELARPSEKRLVGRMAQGDGRLFVAERGGAVHALRLDAEGASASWTQAGVKAALTSLAWAGGRVFALNGSVDDFFRGEQTQLQAFDPASGAVVFQRPVSRPATLHGFGDVLLVTAGGAKHRAGLRVLGAHPKARVDAAAARRLELRSAASDALVEEQYEVAAIVVRKYMRAMGQAELGDDGYEFMARILARSNRRQEALDWLHRAEEQGGVAEQERWDGVRRSLGLEVEEEPEPPALKPPAEGPRPEGFGKPPKPPAGESKPPAGEAKPPADAPKPGTEEPGAE